MAQKHMSTAKTDRILENSATDTSIAVMATNIARPLSVLTIDGGGVLCCADLWSGQDENEKSKKIQLKTNAPGTSSAVCYAIILLSRVPIAINRMRWKKAVRGYGGTPCSDQSNS